MKLLRPLPRAWSRPLTLAVLTAWLVQMGMLLQRSFLEAAPVALAADLARYGSAAQWKGIYYRGEKIGFSVGQTVPSDDGYELQEDGQLQLVLMGETVLPARLRTRAVVDREFRLRSFSFSLDPGTGPIEVEGRVDARTLTYSVTSPSGTRSESRELPEPPALSLNLPRRLAAAGLEAGQVHEVSVFDPATLSNAPMRVEIEARELVRGSGRPIPAFRVRSTFSGITSLSWVTETGEVVREESPMGLVVVRESRDRATAMAVAGPATDMIEAASVVPTSARRIDDERAVKRLRLRLSGVELESPALDGGSQRRFGDEIELVDPRDLKPGPPGTDLAPLLAPQPLIESDAPEIVAEVARALEGAPETPAGRAERLVRYVNARLEKKPTLSIPSALEVLRSGVGDCNEHTALYVAMARAAGIPARIAVGLVHLHGAFYYHAWPEVWVETGPGRGTWLPVDPTLNEYPADATHLRLARGDLSRQVEILGYLGRLQIEVVDLDIGASSAPILVGQDVKTALPVDLPLARPDGPGSCWRAGRRRP